MSIKVEYILIIYPGEKPFRISICCASDTGCGLKQYVPSKLYVREYE